MSKKDILLVPGLGQGRSPILPGATTAAVATAAVSASSGTGSQKSSKVPGGAANLQAGGECKSILNELEKQEGNPQLTHLCQEKFQKLIGAFDKFDKFRSLGPPQPEKEEVETVHIMMRAMTVNYKPSEHIVMFEEDPFQYTKFKTSVEIADQNLFDEIPALNLCQLQICPAELC